MLIVKLRCQGGKTETLVEWVKSRPNRCIITFTEVERRRLIVQYELKDNQVFVYTSNIPRQRSLEVAIDNLDLVLQQVYGDVQIVTVNDDAV